MLPWILLGWNSLKSTPRQLKTLIPCDPVIPLIRIYLIKMFTGESGMFRENSIETCILSRVKQITSPGWMHETSARTCCTGKTQRDRVEREVGGGIEMGTHVNPWLIHVNVWQKPLQYCKVISLQLIKKKIYNVGQVNLQNTCINGCVYLFEL